MFLLVLHWFFSSVWYERDTCIRCQLRKYCAHLKNISDLFESNFKYESAAADVDNCLEQIKLPNLLHACALYSELPSNISAVGMREEVQAFPCLQSTCFKQNRFKSFLQITVLIVITIYPLENQGKFSQKSGKKSV